MFDTKPVIANIDDLLNIAKKINLIKQTDKTTLIGNAVKPPIDHVNLKKKLLDIKKVYPDDETKTIKWL